MQAGSVFRSTGCRHPTVSFTFCLWHSTAVRPRSRRDKVGPGERFGQRTGTRGSVGGVGGSGLSARALRARSPAHLRAAPWLRSVPEVRRRPLAPRHPPLRGRCAVAAPAGSRRSAPGSEVAPNSHERRPTSFPQPAPKNAKHMPGEGIYLAGGSVLSEAFSAASLEAPGPACPLGPAPFSGILNWGATSTGTLVRASVCPST